MGDAPYNDELSLLHSAILERSHSYVTSFTPAEARAQLQGEMNFVWDLLNSIQGIHNSLSILLQLPDELLVEIGWILHQTLIPSWLNQPTANGGLGLLTGFLPVTKICRRLRNLYLSTPKFWTLVDLQTPMANPCIQRSGSLPLYVVCDSSDGSIPESLSDLLMAAMPRARALQLDADFADSMSTLLAPLESCTLPCIRQLSLKVARLPHAQRPDILPLFNPKFQGNDSQPQLHTLLLRGVILRTPSPLYVGLKRLELTSLAGTLIPSEEDFSALLHNCPDLTQLSIQGTGPEFAENCALPPPVLLKRLVTLNLSHHLRNVHGILACMDCPSLRLLTISVLHSTMLDTFRGLFPPHSQLLERIRHKYAKKIEIGGGFTCVDSLDYDLPLVTGDDIKFSVGVSTPRRLFGNIAEVFGSADCHELSVNSSDQSYPATADKREWTTFFNGFSNLVKLHLRHLPDFVKPLAALKPIQQRSGMMLPCPKLRHIEISGFKANQEGYQWVDELRSLTELRSQHGLPLDYLKVGVDSPCYLEYDEEETEEAVGKLGDGLGPIDGLVASFSWDLED